MRICLVLLMFCCSSVNAQNDEKFDLSDYQGKVVYLDFWASWCEPCRKSFPWLNKMKQIYEAQGLVIVGINLDKEYQLAQTFLKEYPAEFNLFYDPQGSLAKKYQIPGMPSAIIFDRDGKAIEAHSGFFQNKIKDYESQIQQALSIKSTGEPQ